MLKEIKYVHIEDNNIHIAYDMDKPPFWLTAEGGDLDDFAEFLGVLCPGFDLGVVSIEEAISLQKQLYKRLYNGVRQEIWLQLLKFREKLEYPSP